MKNPVLAFMCLFWAIPCQARTVVVEADGSGEYATIQAAIDDSNEGDVIILNPGTYTGDGNRDIDFKGKPITVRSTDPNDPAAVAATVIDGEQDFSACLQWTPGMCCCQIHRGFVFQSGEGPNSVLAGLTITRFSAPDEVIWDEPMPAGGGVFCENSSPRISHCIIKDNWAHHLGAGGFGGNICCKGDCSPTITYCTISKGDSYFGVGGIHCPDGAPRITHCIITENHASFSGGGVACGSGATITDCFISKNSGGGGIYGSPVISNCVITHNRSFWRGGGISGSPIISGSTIAHNAVDAGPGGGIYCTGSASISHCIVMNNQAPSGYQFDEWVDGKGGGIYCGQENSTIIQCTIAGNKAGARGGGVYGDPNITNCILWGNTSPNEPAISGNAGVSYSDVAGGWPGTGNINADPCFADAVNGDYHLKSQAGRWDPNSESWVQDTATSPCIDAGNPQEPIGPEPFPNGGIVNMGVYGGIGEASKSYFGGPPCQTIVAGDIDGDCNVDFRDAALMLSHWLEQR